MDSTSPTHWLASCLKGQCHEIFDFWFFSWISFPQAPDYTNRAISNFFEKSRRYSQLKVHHRCQWHRWQMAKIFKQKNCNYFVWAPLGSRVNIYINFGLQVYFKMSAAWYCSHYLQPVSTTPVANLPPVSLIPVAIINNTSETGGKICRKSNWHRRQFCRRCRWHRWQICLRCRWYRWCTLTCEYLREFLKKFETVLIEYSGAWGETDSSEKPEAKNLVTLSL